MTSSPGNVATAAGILRLGNSFCDAQALLTAAELDLFTVLHDRPATEDEIRERLGLHGRGLRDFLRLLAGLGLLVEEGGRYRNATGADRYLVSGQQNYVGGFLRGAKNSLYLVWGGLAEALRTGEPRKAAGSFEMLLNDPNLLGQYVRMLDGLTQVLGPRIIDAFDWSGCRSVADIGGCRGNLAAQLVKAHPHLEARVFELPQLETHFDEHLTETGLTGKVRFQAGDFFTDPLPAADVLVLGHVLPEWNARQRESLIRKAYQAVLPGGTLLIYDRMLDDEVVNLENVVASVTMLLVSPYGSHYSTAEVQRLAEAVGFGSVTHQPLDDNETVMLCHKSGDRKGT